MEVKNITTVIDVVGDLNDGGEVLQRPGGFTSGSAVSVNVARFTRRSS